MIATLTDNPFDAAGLSQLRWDMFVPSNLVPNVVVCVPLHSSPHCTILDAPCTRLHVQGQVQEILCRIKALV